MISKVGSLATTVKYVTLLHSSDTTEIVQNINLLLFINDVQYIVFGV